MMTSFLQGVSGGTGEKVASDWLQHLFGPALLFWGGALLLVSFTSWINPLQRFLDAKTEEQIAWGLAFIALVILSDILSEWATLPLLRRLEGYSWPVWLQDRMVNRWRKMLQEKEARLELLQQGLSGRSLAERKEHLRLDAELALYPEWNHLMPTPIGNLLRAAEEYPYNRYGLDAIIVWPHLWLLLPEPTQQELSTARRQLDRAAQLFGWGMLFWIWTYFTWWAAPVVIITLLIAYFRMIQCATLYSTLIRTAFDLHRFELYEQMRWPLPTKSADELALGKELTHYIWRGSANPDLEFQHPAE